jgi:hypothetical protein
MSKGKLVDTWYFEYNGIPGEDPDRDPEDDEGGEEPKLKPAPKVEGIKVPIELRLHKKFADSAKPPQATKEVWFTVSCKNPVLSFTGSDIEALRCAMWAKLSKHFEVKWEDYFLVRIDHSRVYEGIGTGLTFSYDTIWKGTAWDGSLLLKQYRRFGSGNPEIRPWPGEFRDERGSVVACIPGTKENRAALEEFRKKIDLLRERLADYLRPDRIIETLLTLASIKLLSKGDENGNDGE